MCVRGWGSTSRPRPWRPARSSWRGWLRRMLSAGSRWTRPGQKRDSGGAAVEVLSPAAAPVALLCTLEKPWRAGWRGLKIFRPFWRPGSIPGRATTRRALLRTRAAHRGGVVPRLDAAAVVGDLSVGEETADGDVAHHRADGFHLFLELVLEDQPAADAVEEQHACRPGALQ